MHKVILRTVSLFLAAFIITMLGLYFATEHGVFEEEPLGVIELREQNAIGERVWLKGQVAWIRLDDTHIDYPMMQTSDNRWYLTHDYYGNEAISGAVFLDFRNASDFSDDISIIYGHRMNGDLMFSDVAKYRDANYFLEHQSGELILPERSYRLRVLAYRVVSAEDDLYRDLVLEGFSGNKLILSTCDRDAHEKRDILVLALE